jgi:hypothetical protein
MSWQSDEEIEYLIEAAQRAEVQADRSRPEKEALVEFQQSQKEAEGNGNYFLRCMNCKKKVTGPRFRKALGEGHIYSDEGRREFSMSGLCEFCFDRITAEPKEQENPHILISGSVLTGKKMVMDLETLDKLRRGEDGCRE